MAVGPYKKGTCESCGQAGEVRQIESGVKVCKDCWQGMVACAKRRIYGTCFHFYSKIAGVTKENPDGQSRQKIIRKQCRAGLSLDLVRQPNNKYDTNAIAVFIHGGPQLGYLDRDTAENIVRYMDMDVDYPIACNILNVTGGEDGRYLGVNIVLVVAQPGTPTSEVQRYVNEEVVPEVESNEHERR